MNQIARKITAGWLHHTCWGGHAKGAIGERMVGRDDDGARSRWPRPHRDDTAGSVRDARQSKRRARVTFDRPQPTTERSATDGQPMAQRCVRDPVPMSPLGRCPSRPGAIDPQNNCASAVSRSKGFGGRRRAPRSCSVNPHMAALAHRLDAAAPVLFVLPQRQLEGPSVRRSPPLPDGPG